MPKKTELECRLYEIAMRKTKKEFPQMDPEAEEMVAFAIRTAMEICGYGEDEFEDIPPIMRKAKSATLELLEMLCFDPSKQGTKMLLILVPKMAVSKERDFESASKQMYPWVGERFGGLSQVAVERSIRSARDSAERAMGATKFRKFLGTEKTGSKSCIDALVATVRKVVYEE